MSNPSEKVYQLTLPVLEALAQAPAVVSILCFGSYALDVYDEHSDIDLYVLCVPELMSIATRQAILANLQGVTDLDLAQDHTGWENQWSPQSDRLALNGMTLELSYNTQDWLTNVVHKVIEEGATSLPELTFRPYTMLGLLTNAIVLYDPNHVIAQLRMGLAPYPPLLKEHLISHNLAILTEWLADLQDCATRDFGHSSFLFYLWHLCDALISLLFALNETYDPATKRSEKMLKRLTHLPKDFIARYEKVLEGPFTRSGQRTVVAELTKLIEETKQLLPPQFMEGRIT